MFYLDKFGKLVTSMEFVKIIWVGENLPNFAMKITSRRNPKRFPKIFPFIAQKNRLRKNSENSENGFWNTGGANFWIFFCFSISYMIKSGVSIWCFQIDANSIAPPIRSPLANQEAMIHPNLWKWVWFCEVEWNRTSIDTDITVHLTLLHRSRVVIGVVVGA